MPERKRLKHPRDVGDPLGASFVNALTEKLKELTDNEGVAGQWAGWHYGTAVPGAALWAMFEQNAEGRQVLTGVMLLGESISADQLRKVPIAALENSRNLSQRGLAAYSDMQAELAKLPPLTRGDLASEEFSRLVATHYRVWAAAVPHPAAAMAARAGVKQPTVHSWIREARLRGLLPAGRRRKTG